MKKILLLVLAVLGVQGIQAQNDVEYGIFDHLGAGLSVGTDGIGIDVSSCITDYVGVRAGVSFFPGIKINKKGVHFNGESTTYYNDIDLQAQLHKFDFKLLFDFYPIKTSSFHVTAGAYIGGGKLLSAKNTSPILKNSSDYGNTGLMLGDYFVTTDNQGNAEVNVKVNGFKPYLGIGIGRALPKKSRIAVSADLGVQFWGTPYLFANARKGDFGEYKETKIKHGDLNDDDDQDIKDALKLIEKFPVYPVLNIRLTGRIF